SARLALHFLTRLEIATAGHSTFGPCILTPRATSGFGAVPTSLKPVAKGPSPATPSPVTMQPGTLLPAPPFEYVKQVVERGEEKQSTGNQGYAEQTQGLLRSDAVRYGQVGVNQVRVLRQAPSEENDRHLANRRDPRQA